MIMEPWNRRSGVMQGSEPMLLQEEGGEEDEAVAEGGDPVAEGENPTSQRPRRIWTRNWTATS
jgi:hypothetical protein